MLGPMLLGMTALLAAGQATMVRARDPVTDTVLSAVDTPGRGELQASVHGAPESSARDVSALLKPIREKHDVPGIVGAIVKGEHTVALGADGVRKRGTDVRITVDDEFHLGSCTKSMTATLCAMLVEEKKLSWTTTIGEAFPDLAPNMHEGWHDVTLEQLLTHRAGVPSDLGTDGLWDRLWHHGGIPTAQRETLVEGVLKHAPVSPPGTKFLYSNAGFAIAGAMAERAAREPWEDLIRKRLFDPLGMKSVGFGAPGTFGVLDQPRGHGHDGQPMELGVSSDNPQAIAPAGTVHASIVDWAKYVALHLGGDRAAFDPREKARAHLLTPESFARLHTPPAGADPTYAMGWSIAERDWAGPKKHVLTHNGSNNLWFCVTWLAPERDFAVLVCCNQGGPNADKACDEVAWALIQDEIAHEKSKSEKK
jgi:CubicO group peptidase (beta-lactamase class C family)